MTPLNRFLLSIGGLLIALHAPPALADWKDLPGIKTREATKKAEDRAATEIDKTVDSTVNCVFNPIECARNMKREEAPAEVSAPADGAGARKGPPRPPSAERPKAGPPAPPSARVWHVDIGGGQTQEVRESELIQMIGRGQVERSTPVWTESFGGAFKNAGDVPSLERHFGAR